MRKVIVFDVMGVIFEVGDDTNELLVPYIQGRNPAISKELINDIYLEASFGKISSKDLWEKLGFREDYQRIEKEYLDSCLVFDKEFLNAAEELKIKYDLAIISNDIKEWGEYLREKHNLNRLFSEIIISGEVGLRKPDKRIYELLLSKLKVLPHDCIFVDDRYKNLKMASELGYKTIRFDREVMEKAFEPDGEIKSFSELKGTVERIFNLDC